MEHKTLILRLVKVGMYMVILAQNTRHVQGLTCMECTNIDLDGTSAGIFVNPFLNIIPGIRNENCKAPTSQTDIDLITCPENPETGHHVYRCGAYKGKINIAIAGGISNSSLNIIDRQCVLIYQGLDRGCHPQSFVEEDASDFQKIFASLENLGAVEFEGDICLAEDNDATPAPNCSSNMIVQSLVFILTTCFICIFLS
ncbi:uncharacterized protein LOC132561180 [Ylistrum balloti]|uniref:uncharacterized protein LOC132561180 n=1 Tax=Ylistrum balloti TaxID=509963 RepID=UPI002905AFC2|nr:uncharacterized protein LOC132561180 [Ylistrum balloti]